MEVGAVDDFYELGGHSLLAMQFAGRLEAAAGVRVQMRHLAEAPTPRLLAKVVHTLQAAAAAAAPPPGNGTVGPARHRRPASSNVFEPLFLIELHGVP